LSFCIFGFSFTCNLKLKTGSYGLLKSGQTGTLLCNDSDGFLNFGNNWFGLINFRLLNTLLIRLLNDHKVSHFHVLLISRVVNDGSTDVLSVFFSFSLNVKSSFGFLGLLLVLVFRFLLNPVSFLLFSFIDVLLLVLHDNEGNNDTDYDNQNYNQHDYDNGSGFSFIFRFHNSLGINPVCSLGARRNNF